MNRAEHIEALAAVDALAKALREALNADARTEYELQGVIPSWKLPGFTVSTSLSAATVAITDEDDFLAYVADAFPTEVETVTVTRIRPAWQAMFMKDILARGEACDEDGRVVPGIELRAGGTFGSVSVIPNAETKARLRTAAREIAIGARPFALPSLATDGEPDRMDVVSASAIPSETPTQEWEAFGGLPDWNPGEVAAA